MKKIILITAVYALCANAHSQSWNLTGNAGTSSTTNFIGTTDNKAFKIRTNNSVRITVASSGKVGIGTTSPVFKLDVKGGSINTDSVYRIGGNTILSVKGNANTFLGSGSGSSNTTGIWNTGIGSYALSSNTTGNYNTANGVDALVLNTTGFENTGIGASALFHNTYGAHNTAIGFQSLFSNISGSINTANGVQALFSNTTGGGNTVIGAYGLYSATTGNNNTANGMAALFNNSTGNNNTACGYQALNSNLTGYSNIAIGTNALYSSQTNNNLVAVGDSALFNQNSGAGLNTAIGSKALFANTSGAANTSIGVSALQNNTIGHSNTANGHATLLSNTIGDYNTAIGDSALLSNTFGTHNVANGALALYANVVGTGNTAIGFESLYSNDGQSNTAIGFWSLYSNDIGRWNTAIGREALSYNTTGDYNTAIGYRAGPSFYSYINTTTIGANAIVNASNKVRIGDAGITVIEGQVAYSFPSDGRFKENVKDDVKGLDFIMKLQPVSYNFNRLKFAQHVKQHLTPKREKTLVEQSQNRSVGFIAQDVERVIQQTGFSSFDAVHSPTNETDNYSMAYAEFVVPLVKAVQELNEKNLKSEIRSLKLEEEIESLKSEIRNQKSNQSVISNSKSALLFQNSPNPFNQTTVIRYALSAEQNNGVIIIRDLSGNLVKSVAVSNTGKVQVIINANEFTQGTYTYSLEVAGESVDTKLMVITK